MPAKNLIRTFRFFRDDVTKLLMCECKEIGETKAVEVCSGGRRYTFSRVFHLDRILSGKDLNALQKAKDGDVIAADYGPPLEKADGEEVSPRVR